MDEKFDGESRVKTSFRCFMMFQFLENGHILWHYGTIVGLPDSFLDGQAVKPHRTCHILLDEWKVTWFPAPLEQAILAMILLLVILPAWRMYILPKAAWTATCRLQVGG